MRIRVVAPATVANLGPGFDCLGLALDLHNEFEVDTDAGPSVTVEGEGADELPADGSNLVLRTAALVATAMGRPLPPVSLRCRNRIPLERGLGSSATAVVAGVLIAHRLLGASTDRHEILRTAVEVEGHADNVAACIGGGLSVAYRSEDGWRAEFLRPSSELRPVVLVPDSERVGTQGARGALPERVPLADAVFNISRTALTVLALTERPELLATALQDRLHQPRRLPLAPGARRLFEALQRAGVPVCVCGSGPSLLAFEREDLGIGDPGPSWRVLRPGVSLAGARIEEGFPT